MASNINPYNIDGTFPVAGQDNDSQGFRDNFTNISNNFSTAATEISDLQSKAILKSALTGQTINNNMAGSSISAVALTGASYTMNDQGTVSGAVSLDFSTGNLQKITTGGSVTLSFANWPTAGTMGSMVVWLVVTNAAHTVTVSVTSPGVTIGLENFPRANTATGVITFDEAGTYLIGFDTIDAGQNIFITNASGNSAEFTGYNFYYNPNVNPTILIGYGNGIATAQSFEDGTDAISVKGGYDSVMIGNLQLATNVSVSAIDTGPLSGYGVTAAYGNLTTGSILPVNGYELLGIVDASTFTGNGAGNAFTQVSAIGYYATGANVVYGVGGNIAFFTRPDGGAVNQINQAVGIENDQSTRVFGNLISGTGSSSSSYVPNTSTANGVPGQMAWDSTYFYICTATNTWKRVQLNLTSW